MYGMKLRKNVRTPIGNASGRPSSAIISHWVTPANARSTESDHVAAEDLGRVEGDRVERWPPVGRHSPEDPLPP